MSEGFTVSKQNRYDGIDCLRTLGCFGIIAMHVRSNADYQIEGVIYNTIVPSWTWFVYMFLIISGFGICCGYYDKIANRTIDINQFYIRRFKKTGPFFACLVLLAVIMEKSLDGIYEGLMEVTMAFGLLPNNQLSVLGVCWTLGVIFLFYMLFPYFVFLLGSRRRAWVVLIITLLINQMCSQYFFMEKFVIDSFVPRHSFLFCTPFFVGGGIIYLYREEIVAFVSKFRRVFFAVCVGLTVVWYLAPQEAAGVQLFTLESLILFVLWLSYAIGTKSIFMNNRFMKYFGGISMEMYLAQMVVFRVIEKAGLLYKLGNGWLSFGLVMILEIGLLVVGIEVWKWIAANLIKFTVHIKTRNSMKGL